MRRYTSPASLSILPTTSAPGPFALRVLAVFLADNLIDQYHSVAPVGLVEGLPIGTVAIGKLSAFGTGSGELKVLQEVSPHKGP